MLGHIIHVQFVASYREQCGGRMWTFIHLSFVNRRFGMVRVPDPLQSAQNL